MKKQSEKMMLNLCRPDLPPDWNDYAEPEWTERTISYYKQKFIVSKKTYENFIDEISDCLDLEEIQVKDLTDNEIKGIKIIQEENTEYTKIWKVKRNRKSELYYRYLYSYYAFDSEFVSVYYRKDLDVFRSSCTLLDCRLRMMRGINQEDIDRNTNEYIDYYMAFFGYNECLNEIFESLNDPVVVHTAANSSEMIRIEFD